MEEQPISLAQRVRNRVWLSGMFIMYLLDLCRTWFKLRVSVIMRESDLFLGIALCLIGFFGFESGRYCDGNSADYLSCTRPATYYFYDVSHTALIVLGVFLITVWFIRSRR